MNIEKEGKIFTPRYDNEGIIATAEEVYQEWLNQQNSLPIPSKIEMLEQELAITNALILELTELTLGGM